MDSGQSGYLDLLITTLTEHEKSLDEAIQKLEKIAAELRERIPAETESQQIQEVPEEAFHDVVGEALLKLPKGYNFEICKVTHTAYVKVTTTEPSACWERRLRREVEE